MAEDFGSFYEERSPTFMERIWYFFNGLLVVAPTIYLFHSVFGVDVMETYWLYAPISFIAAIILSDAYHNVAYWLRIRLHLSRDGTVTKNMVKSAFGKNNKEKVVEVKKQQKKDTNSESDSFAILYNNFFFLFAFFLISFYLFPTIPVFYNYGFGVVGSCALVNFVSHQALKRT